MINWTNSSDRKQFEDKIRSGRQQRQKWSTFETFLWAFQIFVVPYTIVIGFYGTCAYFLYQKALRDGSTNRENNFLINHYSILTSICQTLAFLCVALYNFTDYRKWNFLGTGMAVLCLPFDVYLMYKEPLGPILTIFGLVAGFIPLIIPIADAIFPEEQITVKIQGKQTLTTLDSCPFRIFDLFQEPKPSQF